MQGEKHKPVRQPDETSSWAPRVLHLQGLHCWLGQSTLPVYPAAPPAVWRAVTSVHSRYIESKQSLHIVKQISSIVWCSFSGLQLNAGHCLNLNGSCCFSDEVGKFQPHPNYAPILLARILLVTLVFFRSTYKAPSVRLHNAGSASQRLLTHPITHYYTISKEIVGDMPPQ